MENVKNQFRKVISLSPSKSLSKKRKPKEQTKSTSFKKEAARQPVKSNKRKSQSGLSFKDLNTHFNSNLLTHDLERTHRPSNVLAAAMDRNLQNSQPEDSSDESTGSLSSANLSLQTSSSTSSSSASIGQQANCEPDDEHNFAQCLLNDTKTSAKKSFIEQRFRVALEQTQLSTMLHNHNGVLNTAMQCADQQPQQQPNAGQLNIQLNSQLVHKPQVTIPNYPVQAPAANYQHINYDNYDQVPDLSNGQSNDQSNGHSNYCSSTPTASNNLNCATTVSFNNLVNLATSQFKPMSNRVWAAESKTNSKLYVNSMNERRKLTVQNNLVRQASFTYNPCNSPNGGQHQSSCSNHGYQPHHHQAQPSTLERNNLTNLKAFLNRNKHLTAAADSHSDSECANLNKFDCHSIQPSNAKCTLTGKCSNVELLNRNLNRPLSISQQSSPSHRINYKEKLCCMSRANWPAYGEPAQYCNQSNVYQQSAAQQQTHFDQMNQQNFHNQLNQQLSLVATTPQRHARLTGDSGRVTKISLENYRNEEILQVNKQIDCLKSNLLWYDQKELNYLTSSQTMPSPSKLKHSALSSSSSLADNTITSLINLNSNAKSLSDSTTNNSIKSLIASSTTTLNSSNTLHSSASQSTNNTLEANYSLTMPFSGDTNNQQANAKGCSSNCSLNELKKLHCDLQQSNQKVHLLTEQLNTNAQMVSAFEQSLHRMTNRIHQLTRASNEKELELTQFKQLIRRLLNVDDLKASELEQLMSDLNEEPKDNSSKLSTPCKQLIRRHTFTDEMQLKLSKCKSLETCAKIEPLDPSATKKDHNRKGAPDKSAQRYSTTDQALENRNLDSESKASSWSKLAKAFKKLSLSKYSPMHRAASGEHSGAKVGEASSRVKNAPNIVEHRQSKNQAEHNADLFDDSSLQRAQTINEELKKELDDKEKLLCDLRLANLANQHQMDNLRTELMSIKRENERLNRLIKAKSSLMSSKASLFSVSSSLAADGTNGASVCNISTGNAGDVSSSNITTHHASVNNASSTNLATSSQSPSSLLTGNTLSTARTSSTGTSTSLVNRTSSSANQVRIDALISPNSITSNELSYVESGAEQSASGGGGDSARHSADQRQAANLELLKQRHTLNEQINRMEESGAFCPSSHFKASPSDDSLLLLGEGKLVNVKWKLWNENFVAHQASQPDQVDVYRSKFDSVSGLSSSSSSNEIGLLRVGKQTSWQDLSLNLKQLIVDYLNSVDTGQSLGVSLDSVHCYEIGDTKETFYLEHCFAEHQSAKDAVSVRRRPYDYLTDDSRLEINLKCKSLLEQFVLQTLIPKSVMLRMIGQFSDTSKRLVLSGPSEQGKTYMAHRLAEYLIQKLNAGDCLSTSSSLLSGGDSDSASSKLEINQPQMAVGSIASYQIDAQNCQNLYHYLNGLVQQYEQQANRIDYRNLPTVLVIDNLQFIEHLDQTFSPLAQLANTSYSPYVIGTLDRAPNNGNGNALQNLQLSNNFRWLTFANHLEEPAHGLLSRYLRKQVCARAIEQKLNYMSEFNLLDIDERKPAKDASLRDVLLGLECKKVVSFKIIDWLDAVLKHLNRFIRMHSQSASTLAAGVLASCPVDDLEKTRDWFNRCWNNSLVPYLNEIIAQSDAKHIEDPSVWVIKSSYEMDQNFNLKTLNLNEFRQPNERTAHSHLDPLVHALTNLNKLTSQ